MARPIPIRWLLGALATTLLFTSCAQEVGLIDRTQPGLLAKTVFEGEWFMRRTVIDAPYDTGFTFIGEQDEVDRIRWEVQEGHLIAWRVLAEVEGTQDAAPSAVFAIEAHVDVIRDYNTSTGEQTNLQVENTEDRPWYDRDYIRVDWSRNLVTNFNFYVEMLEQDPVAYFVEDADDPDRLLVGVREADGSWTDEQDPSAHLHIKDAQYLDVVTRVFVKPEEIGWWDWDGNVEYEPACWYYGNVDCAPATLTVRSSFLRVDAAVSDYIPLSYPDNTVLRDDAGDPIRVRWNAQGNLEQVNADGTTASGQAAIPGGQGSSTPSDPYAVSDASVVRLPLFDKFGYFRTERYGYDPLYAEVESERTFLINRWNIWERSTDEAGNPLPYAQRTIRPIVYYLSPDFPANLRPAAQAVADQWDIAFRETVESLTGKPVTQPIFELRDNTRVVDPVSGKVLVRGEVNGDLRYSHIWLVDQPTRVGLLGYGPSAADPMTGELFAADAYVYGGAVKEYAAMGRDIIDMMNGKLDPEDFAAGENIQSYIANLKKGGTQSKQATKEEVQKFAHDHRSAPAPAKFKGADKSKNMPRPSQAMSMNKPGIEALQRPAGWGTARLSRMKDTGLEDLLISDPAILAMKGKGMVSPDTPVGTLSAGMRARLSPVSWASPAKRRASLDRLRSLAKRNMMMAAFFDDAVAGLALEHQNTPSDQVVQILEAEIFSSTAEHEVGHTVGLRHNFEASSDALNFPSEYWALRGAGHAPLDPYTTAENQGKIQQYMYSSIMDYHGRFNTDISGIGPYDRAAIKFGYGQLVEVFNQSPLEPMLQIKDQGDGTHKREFTLDEVLRKWRHYTSIPGIFGGVPGIADRTDVPYTREVYDLMPQGSGSPLEDQLTGTSAWVRWEVPYRFCSDEYELGTATCNMFDLGADENEVARDIAHRFRNYYWFNNFKRDRIWFDEWDYLDSMWWRYFSVVKSLHDHWVFGQWYDADTWEWLRYDATSWGIEDVPWEQAGDGGLALSGAAREGLLFLNEVLATPAPGAYWYDYSEGYWWAFDSQPMEICEGEVSYYSEEWCADTNLGLGPARYFESIYDAESGYYFYERLKWIGSFYDKLLALETMTSPDTYFLGIDTSASADVWAISMYGSFKKEIQQVFSGVAADRFSLFSGTFSEENGGEYVPPDLFDASNQEWVQTNGAVDPMTSFTMQLYALWYGMAWLNANYDNTFNDASQVWVEGASEGFTPSGVTEDQMVRFQNPFNNRTYVSMWPQDEELWGVGATMLDEASYWANIWYDGTYPIGVCDGGGGVLCGECDADADCAGLPGGACRFMDDWEGYRCTTSCASDADCAADYLCRLLPEDEETQYCVPAGEYYPDDVDYYKWRVTNMTENIEVVRGLYDMYGYMIF